MRSLIPSLMDYLVKSQVLAYPDGLVHVHEMSK